MKTISVIAAEGLQVPREDNARKYITDASPATVPASPYYMRRLRTGELVEKPAAPAKKVS